LKNFDEYYEDIDEDLNEDATAVLGQALGYSATGLFIAFGGTLLAYGGVKAIETLVRLWKRIIRTAKNIKNPYEINRELKSDDLVKRETVKLQQAQRKYEDNLKRVYDAIEKKDWELAREEFLSISKTLQNLPDINKAVIGEIVKVTKEPPLYIKSPGNVSYQAIKKVLNIKVARAAATATELKMKEINNE